MGHPYLGASSTNFMAILQSIDCSKLGRYLNAADEISARLLSRFLEYEVLLVVTDRYDFEFSVKAAKAQLMCRKLELLITETSKVSSKLPWEFEQ